MVDSIALGGNGISTREGLRENSGFGLQEILTTCTGNLLQHLGELRLVGRRLRNWRAAYSLCAALVLAPILKPVIGIKADGEAGISQQSSCILDATAAAGRVCDGGEGSVILACNGSVNVGQIAPTRDPYKPIDQQGERRVANVAINDNGRLTISSCPVTTEDIENALQNNGNVGVEGAGTSAVSTLEPATPVSGQTPEVPVTQTSSPIVSKCTIDGLGYRHEGAGYPPKTNLPLLGDLELDPARLNIDYFIIDTTATDDQRVQSVFDQLNAALGRAMPYLEISSPEAILRLAEADFPYTFPAGEKVVLTSAELSDIVTFLECTQPGYVTRLYDPFPAATATPLSAPEHVLKTTSQFEEAWLHLFRDFFRLPGKLFNWLRSLAPDARSLIKQEEMVELATPLSRVESGYSGRINARYKDILSQLSDSNHPLASFYEERIGNAPNGNAVKVWGQRARNAGVI